MTIVNIAKSSAIVGLATLGTGALLQKLYQVTNYTPPAPVFWFFMGFSAYMMIEGAEHLLGQELLLEDAHHVG